MFTVSFTSAALAAALLVPAAPEVELWVGGWFSDNVVRGNWPTGAVIDDFIFEALNDAGSFPGIGVGATFTSIQGPLNGFNALKIAPRSAEDLMGYAAP